MYTRWTLPRYSVYPDKHSKMTYIAHLNCDPGQLIVKVLKNTEVAVVNYKHEFLLGGHGQQIVKKVVSKGDACFFADQFHLESGNLRPNY